MYVNPFVCGIIFTLILEIVGVVIYGIHISKKQEVNEMVITNYNEMSIFELDAINKSLGIFFEIERGKIVGTENIPVTDRESEQG